MGQTASALGGALALDFGIQFLGWLHAIVFKTDRYFDALGSLTYVLLTLRSYLLQAWRRKKRQDDSKLSDEPAANKGAGGDANPGGGGDGGTAAQPSLFHPRQVFASSAVLVWAVRLGSFLLARNVAAGGDSRFVKVLDKPSTFAIFWAYQGTWCFFNMLPVIINTAKTPEQLADKPLNRLDFLGMVGTTLTSTAPHPCNRLGARVQSSLRTTWTRG
jgi:hypothetical protein